MKNKKDHIYKEEVKNYDPKDFFGQVKRTVNGKSVSEEDIQLIVKTIVSNLHLEKKDKLLDIGCGNGALASMFFDEISGYLGVDFSEYLIQIAKDNFSRPNYNFLVDEVVSFLENSKRNENITKILCYGVFSYFSREDSIKILNLVIEKFPKTKCFYLGNIPDRSRAENFYYENIDFKNLLDDYTSSIGMWWSKEQFINLAEETNWKIEFFQMPETFYSSHYRFDAILTRNNDNQ